ncbi:hypothetical protein Leryth_025339 [Lithospermum erythrorhizon]|nr:hypothetical protein Leryth_025339 [Lithospermum erythrorhizon]
MQSRLLSYSQTMPPGNPQSGVASTTPTSNQKNLPPKNHKNNKLKDKRYDSFKTWSGKLERQLTMRGKRRPKDEVDSYPKPDMEILLVHRYFDALKGPELDTLRVWLLPISARYQGFHNYHSSCISFRNIISWFVLF